MSPYQSKIHLAIVILSQAWTSFNYVLNPSENNANSCVGMFAMCIIGVVINSTISTE